MEIRYQIRRPIRLEAHLTVEGFTVLLGESGAGKSTLLKALAGLLPAEGTPFSGLPPERRPVGYLPQDLALFPHLRAWENVAFPLKDPPREARRKALLLLERVGLLEHAEKRPHQLSGGQRQRVALARALARGAELLLLDEPTSNLDALTRTQVLAELVDLIRKEGLPTLAVSHDPDLVGFADRLAVLLEGRIVQEGPTPEVLARPAESRVARLLGYANVFPVEVGEGGVWAGGVFLRLPLPAWARPGARAFLAVRAEEVLVVRPDRPKPQENTLQGTLETLYPEGLGHRGRFQGPLTLEILLPRHVQERLRLQPGQPLEVVLKSRYLHLMPR